MTDTSRCQAAHPEDPTPCQGPGDAVTVSDRSGNSADGCEHHAARLLASLEGGHLEPGTVEGAAIRVFESANRTRPYPWLADAPRTDPTQAPRAENHTTGHA